MPAAPSNTELQSWDSASRLVALVERIRPRFDSDGLNDLNPHEHLLLALYELDSQVSEGGFGAWLYHTDRSLIRTTVDCLQRLPDPHDLVTNIVSCLLADIEPSAFDLPWHEWDDYLSQRDDLFWNRVNVYDLAFGSIERTFIEAVWSYAAKIYKKVRSP